MKLTRLLAVLALPALATVSAGLMPILQSATPTPVIVVLIDGTPYALASLTPVPSQTSTLPATVSLLTASPTPTPTRIGLAQTNIVNMTATAHMVMLCDNPIRRVVITAKALNIRSGPGVEFRDIGDLERGDETDVIEVSGNWLRICGDGWISATYVANAARR
jgi:uncharacterized protein YgiM (DUF1202 family)